MSDSLHDKTIGMVHAVVFTVQTIQPFIDRILPGVKVLHIGDDTIQETNLHAGIGTVPPHNYAKFVGHAQNLHSCGADLVMLMCSTYNQAVEFARPMCDVPLLQIDRPMMDLAVAQGPRVGLLATLPMTVPASERLLRRAASDADTEVQVTTELCSEAFEALRSGDTRRHNEMLLDRIDELSRHVDAIVMAQLSMSVLEDHLTDTRVPVYTSARTGLERAGEMLVQKGTEVLCS